MEKSQLFKQINISIYIYVCILFNSCLMFMYIIYNHNSYDRPFSIFLFSSYFTNAKANETLFSFFFFFFFFFFPLSISTLPRHLYTILLEFGLWRCLPS